MGISIKFNDAQYFEEHHIKDNEGNDKIIRIPLYGAALLVTVNNINQKYSTNTFNFIEVVHRIQTTNPEGKDSWFIDPENDDSHLPYYYDPQEEKRNANHRLYPEIYNGLFWDKSYTKPEQITDGDSWEGTLYIMQILPNGRSRHIGTIYWGWSYSQGKVTIIPAYGFGLINTISNFW